MLTAALAVLCALLVLVLLVQACKMLASKIRKS